MSTSLAFNPADYFTYVFDQEIRSAGMPGGYCGFALHLQATPDLQLLQQRLDLLVERFPKVSAEIVRQGKRQVWQANGKRIALQVEQCRAGETLLQRIVEIFNRCPDQPLSLFWIADGVAGSLLFNWNHPLLDARGAKIVLDFLTSDQPERFFESGSLIAAKLAQWSWLKKLGLLIKAKRHNQLANSVDSCLPTKAESGPQRLEVLIRRYDREQSQTVARLAQQHTGLAGRTLYYLGCFIRAMELEGPPAVGEGYCIPYAFNLRRQHAPTPVLGNHVGCLFARASRSQARDRQGLFAHLLAEHQRAVRDELDMAYLPLMWLGQWLPPPRYAKLLRKQHSGNELSSLWFSDVGDLTWGDKGFLGIPVTGMTMLCWMTLPPGLALLIGYVNGELSLSFNYLKPAVDAGWLERVANRMEAELFGVDV
ncbi:hypothetical protein [Methylomonas sp. HYX-M1]|uniref:hypothetical protein n=1 Tax=Methylomonas sp. HYX-M1 TaxID=3139307 RepID=UPI00345C3A3D